MSLSDNKPSLLGALQKEMRAERSRSTRYMREAADRKKENTILRRRLAGALYQIYGNWQRVNQEMPS